MLLIAVLIAPSPVAERYTSPTQDGQFLVHPIRSYRFIVGLTLASSSAALTKPGDALTHAKVVFADAASKPVKVSLLYLGHRDSYEHVTRSGKILSIESPPDLVWEIWGREVDPSSPFARMTEVMGFLDYRTGHQIGTLEVLRALPEM